MKRNIMMALFGVLMATVSAQVSTTWRIEAGYVQPYQFGDGYRTTYFHGGKLGALVDVNFKYNLSLQTGLTYSLAYGVNRQNYPYLGEYVRYSTQLHQLDVPVRAMYKIQLPKQFALFAFAGPTFQVGLYAPEKSESHLSELTAANTGIVSGVTNLYVERVLPFNFMLGLGGGLEWRDYRLQAGYDFGLHNLYRNDLGCKMYQRNWFVSFSYAF